MVFDECVEAEMEFKHMECPKQEMYGCKFQIINERYAFEIKIGLCVDSFGNNCQNFSKIKPSIVYLYDLFYKQKREIKNDIELNERSFDNIFVVLDSQNVLFCENSDPSNSKFVANIQLLYFDFDAMECKVLDKQTRNGSHRLFTVDKQNPSQFICQVNKKGDYFLQKACVQKGKIQFSEQFCFNNKHSEMERRLVHHFMGRCKLEGDKIYGMCEEESCGYCFGEFTLKLPAIEYRQIRKIDMGMLEERPRPTVEHSHFLWIGNQCYCLHKQPSKLRILLFKFDMDAGLVTKLNWSVLSEYSLPFCYEDGFLNICTRKNKSNQHFLHKVSVGGKPDKLLNLAMKAVQERLFSSNQVECDKIVPKLPQKLRPFEK